MQVYTFVWSLGWTACVEFLIQLLVQAEVGISTLPREEVEFVECSWFICLACYPLVRETMAEYQYRSKKIKEMCATILNHNALHPKPSFLLRSVRTPSPFISPLQVISAICTAKFCSLSVHFLFMAKYRPPAPRARHWLYEGLTRALQDAWLITLMNIVFSKFIKIEIRIQLWYIQDKPVRRFFRVSPARTLICHATGIEGWGVVFPVSA